MIVAFIALGFLLVLAGIAIFITNRIIRSNFKRAPYPPYAVADYFYDHYREQYPRKSISFRSGKNRLQGYVYGEKNDMGLIVFAHGLGSGHEYYMQEILSFVDRGWRVLAYDATGSGESEGKGTVGLVQSARDLHAALTYVESETAFTGLPICLVGHSWGGYAVTAGLFFEHRVTASVSLAPYCDPTDMMLHFASKNMGKWAKRLRIPVKINMLLTFGKHYNLTAIDGINKSCVPVLLIHGTQDEMIPIEEVSVMAQIHKITNPKVVYRVYDRNGQTGHNSIFYNASSVPYIQEVIASFKALEQKYSGKIPNEERSRFFDSVDRDIINKPNDELLDEIHEFLTQSISHTNQ
ncbi:MAG: alpha/beta fold hydrolase [Clostridia bacterium]|nr:alpha/beta fold hydrolase [Clostridia bacterium]